MKIFFGIVALSFAVAVEDSERLLEEGHTAFARGDYAGAAARYEQAEMVTTEPARAAFYLAGAQYQLAARKKGASLELLEAEKSYRCCLDPSDARRPSALYGLGNCLLHKAGVRDADGLRAAIICYNQCLQSAGDDAELAANTRYNREKARLLLLQFQPPPKTSRGKSSPPDDVNPYAPRPDPRRDLHHSLGEQGGDEDGSGQAKGTAGEPQAGSDAAKANDPPAPGKGNLDPIPDEVDVPPLSPHDASEHLERAARSVLRERQTFHRRSERAAAPNVRDW